MDRAPGFGAELRRLREAAGLGLAELSRRINYSKGHLSKIENGRARPHPAMAERCDEVLGTGGALRALLPDAPPAGASRRDPAPPRSPAWIRPGGLPRDTAVLYGRDSELDEVMDAVAGAGADDPGMVRVCAVVGMGGVGKTALAVRAAHRLRGRFPDGCLFMDLHGYSERAMVEPADALDRLLRRLDVPGERIPAHMEDRAALFRDCVEGRSLLLFLDNVRDAAHVLPLLPAANGCAVLVTSRNGLRALEDAHRVRLAPLPRRDAVQLLRALAENGHGVGGTSGSVLDGIAERCQGLPLALRIASAQFRVELDVGKAAGTGPREDGLADLDDGERNLAGVFEASLRALAPDLRRTYLALGLHPGPDFDLRAAAAMAETGPDTARDRLRRLLGAHLLVGHRPGRFEFHDLLRRFARERARAVLPRTERDEALRRTAGYYLRSVEAADRLITPHRHRIGPVDEDAGVRHEMRDYGEALDWVIAEEANLVAVSRAAAEAGLDEVCWRLAFALRGYLFLVRTWGVWIETHELALRAARRAGDQNAEAVTLNNLGLAHLERGDHDAAAVHYERARLIFGRLGDEHGVNTALAHLAWVHFRRGDPHTALAQSRRALAFVERHGLARNRAILLRDTAFIEMEIGRYADAVPRLRGALEEFTALGLHVDAAMALNCLGEAQYRLGRAAEARESLRRAAVLGRTSGSRHEEARAHDRLGWVEAGAGNWNCVLAHWYIAQVLHAVSRCQPG